MVVDIHGATYGIRRTSTIIVAMLRCMHVYTIYSFYDRPMYVVVVYLHSTFTMQIVQNKIEISLTSYSQKTIFVET